MSAPTSICNPRRAHRWYQNEHSTCCVRMLLGASHRSLTDAHTSRSTVNLNRLVWELFETSKSSKSMRARAQFTACTVHNSCRTRSRAPPESPKIDMRLREIEYKEGFQKRSVRIVCVTASMHCVRLRGEPVRIPQTACIWGMHKYGKSGVIMTRCQHLGFWESGA